MYGISPLYSYSAPGFTRKAGLKLTNIKLDFRKDTAKLASGKKLLLLLENNIRGGSSSVMVDRHVVSDVTKQIFYTDANNLYGWAMSQYLPTGDFEKLTVDTQSTQSASWAYGFNDSPIEQLVDDSLQIPVENEYGFFTECDLDYPAKIEESENFPLCPYQVEANCELFSDYMNFVKQPKYKPTQKLECDLINKQKYMMHYCSGTGCSHFTSTKG